MVKKSKKQIWFDTQRYLEQFKLELEFREAENKYYINPTKKTVAENIFKPFDNLEEVDRFLQKENNVERIELYYYM